MALSPCCGHSLKKATIIIAALEIVLGFVSGIFYLLGVVATASPNLSLDQVKALRGSFYIPFVDLEKSSRDEILGVLFACFLIALLSCILVIAFSTFLLMSLQRKENENHLKIWLVYKVVLLVLAYVFIFVVAISGYSTLPSAIIDILSAAMHTYFFWVVYTYWKELQFQFLQENPSITPVQETFKSTTFSH